MNADRREWVFGIGLLGRDRMSRVRGMVAVLGLLVASGCSSSDGGAKWRGGPWKDSNFAALNHVLTRAGHPAGTTDRYSIACSTAPGTLRNGFWWHANGEHAHNAKRGNYVHDVHYKTNPNNPNEKPPDELERHEQEHSAIESSPEHGGDPLPAELRRPHGAAHPREIFVDGRWQNVRNIVQGRWPSRIWNAVVEFVKPGRAEPVEIECGYGPLAERWHR